jgi:hypothetical protein
LGTLAATVLAGTTGTVVGGPGVIVGIDVRVPVGAMVGGAAGSLVAVANTMALANDVGVGVGRFPARAPLGVQAAAANITPIRSSRRISPTSMNE